MTKSPTPLSDDAVALREKIRSTVEAILLRRILEEKLAGYTLRTSEQIADAILKAIEGQTDALAAARAYVGEG